MKKVIFMGDSLAQIKAFPKKTQQTRKLDIDLARKRLSLVGNIDDW